MSKGQKETLKIRAISTAFVVLALAVFKPFGLETWQWQAYVHLFIIFVIGFVVCMLTDALMKYVLRMPCNMDDIHEIDYFIRRNFYFQIINTILISLMICLYRHLFLTDQSAQGDAMLAKNQLSWSNFFETLLIIAFCSFAVGLYWRFKFRGKYLAAELEETKILNDQLQRMQQESESKAQVTEVMKAEKNTDEMDDFCQVEPSPSTIQLTGMTNEAVTLNVSHLLYIEAVGNYVKVYHLHEGRVRVDMLRATSKQMETDLQPYPMIVRCHRAFLVNLGQVEQVISRSGTMQLLIKHSHESIPVSRSNVPGIKAAIKRGQSDASISFAERE